MRGQEFEIQLLADPGAQSMCRILGVTALYDPEIISGTIAIESHGDMLVQFRLRFREPERSSLLVARLKNLVGILEVRMVTL